MRETISTATANCVGLDSGVDITIKRTCSLCKFRLRIHALGNVGERFSTLGTLRRYNNLIRLREWPHLCLGYYITRVGLFVCKSKGYVRVVMSQFGQEHTHGGLKCPEMESGT
jgi:hypothetical protein